MEKCDASRARQSLGDRIQAVVSREGRIIFTNLVEVTPCENTQAWKSKTADKSVASTSSTRIYRSVDESGVVHFSNLDSSAHASGQ